MQQIKAILLLLLFSISTIASSTEIHYCKGELTDISFFGNTACICDSGVETTEHKHCQKAEKKACHKTPNKSESKTKKQKKDCCNTETIQAFDQLKISASISISTPAIILLATLNPYFFTQKKEKPIRFLSYNEPVFWEDIPIIHQSFLI